MQIENTLKTSAEWYKEDQELFPGFIILDPDGWDRKNYDYSFNVELIDRKEFDRRVLWSTIQIPKSMLDVL